MAKNKKIEVNGTEISIFQSESSDYISLTDIARYKDNANTDDIIKNWLRNRNTIELLGFWEQMYNPDFKPVEFDGFRKQAGLNSFVLSPKKWIEILMPLALYLNLEDTVVLLPTRILLLNLLLGFLLSSSFILSKNFNA